MAHVAHYFTRFETGYYYHVYNRSVDKRPMFMSTDNRLYFLQRYKKYISPVADTCAYCLMGNHFHLLLRIRPLHGHGHTGAAAPAAAAAAAPDLSTFTKLTNLAANAAANAANTATPATPETTPAAPWVPPGAIPPQPTTHDIVSHQFRKFFQSYAMAFNKQQQRVGTLFQTPFKRALVDSNAYLKQLVYYIHSNPQNHGSTDDYRTWPWSSYAEIMDYKNRGIVDMGFYRDLFGSKAEIAHFHMLKQEPDLPIDLVMDGLEC